jgi:hypothetical protein
VYFSFANNKLFETELALYFYGSIKVITMSLTSILDEVKGTYYEVYNSSGSSDYLTLQEASKHFSDMKATGCSCILVRVDRGEWITDREILQFHKT